MGRRGPQPSQRLIKVSANIPTWKYDILQALGVHTTNAINHGIDLFLEDTIQSGRVSQNGMDIYITTLEKQIGSLQDKVDAARNILETKNIHQAPSGQVRVWDKDIQELRIIPASQFDKALHEIREVITA